MNNFNNNNYNNNNSYDNFRPPQSTLGQQPRIGDNFMMGSQNNLPPFQNDNNWGGNNNMNNMNDRFGNNNNMGSNGYSNPFQQSNRNNNNDWNNSFNDRTMGGGGFNQTSNITGDFNNNYNNNNNYGNNYNNNNFNNNNGFGGNLNQSYQPNQNMGMGYNNNNNNWGNNNNNNFGIGGNNMIVNNNMGMPNQFNQPGLSHHEMQQYDQVMRRISNFTKSAGSHRNLDGFFYPYDCYQGRLLEDWELIIMFPILQPDEERLIIRGLEDPMNKNGKVDFQSLSKTLQVTYNNGLVLQQLRQNSVYQDKIRNISIPLTRLEMIAKQVLECDRLGSYKASFEKVHYKKTQITQDELLQVLSMAGVKADKNEITQIFNYLAIDNYQQVSKIQFVQGFKNVIPEANALFSGRNDTQGLGFQQNNGTTIEQTKYLREISQHITKYNLTLPQLLNDIGVSAFETHITKSHIEQLGRQCRVTQALDPNQLNDLVVKLEDKDRMNYILITVLEKKLNEFSSISSNQIPATEAVKFKLSVLKEYMNKMQAIELEDIFENIQDEKGLKVVDKAQFMRILMNPIIGKTQEEAENIALTYITTTGQINVTQIKNDLELISEDQNDITQEKATELVNNVLEQVKRFLAKNEVNLVDIFLDSDEDDGYLDRNELRQAFVKLGQGDLKNEQISAFFKILDPYNTKKIDQQQIIDKFYEYANKDKVVDQTHKYFKIFEKVRQHLQQKRHLSVSTIFVDDNFNRNNEIQIETSDFLNILKQVVHVSELQNRATEQTFAFSLLGTAGKIDYQKFADQVGYVQPERKAIMAKSRGFGDSQAFGKGVFKFEQRRLFYRTLMKSITSKDSDKNSIFNSQKDRLEYDLKEADTNLQGIIYINTFGNLIIRHCPFLQQDLDLIELVARDYMLEPVKFPNQVFYEQFMERVIYEFNKLKFLNKVYRNFYETLEFRAITNLYTLFEPFEKQGNEKKFDSTQLRNILMKRGITADDKEIKFFLDEYDPEKSGYVRYLDIEKDYKDLTEELRLRGHSMTANLPQVLQCVKRYMDNKGKTLREIFNKTKVGDSDLINQYQFTRIINEMSRETRIPIQESSIFKFMLELSAKESNAVSFTELNKLFNSHFNLKDDDERLFMGFYIEKLQWYIVRTAIDRKITGFKLEEHFSYPNSTYSQFQLDLKKDPLNCFKESTQQVIDEMCRKYQEGHFINTQLFIVDLNEKMFKQEQKNQIMYDLRKQVMLKNLDIEEVFYRAIPEIKKFNIVYLSPQEFQSVFLFLEYKISLDRVQKMLSNFFQPDNYEKYSYIEFIEEFKNLVKTNQQFNGRKNFQNLEEILKRIASCIEQRQMRNVGSLLADQDLKNQNMIEKESFFRVMDSLQFGLGEGDIQEMIRVYKKDANMVDIVRVRDDINAYIIVPDFRIQLKSLLHQVVKERIVENIDLSPKSSKKKTSLEQEAITTFMPLIHDILCGLYVRGSDVAEWFARFSSIVKGSIQVKEFISAVETLDVRIGDSSFNQLYYTHLIQRQEVYLGYKSQMLLIDQLQQIIQKDCSFTKDQMQEMILLDIAQHFTNHFTPIQDQIQIFDNSSSGLVYRSDFVTNILDNYLHLSNILTINKKLLITQRYAPSESQLQLRYSEFIQDLLRIQSQNPTIIKICLTRDDVDRQQELNKEAERREIERIEQEQKLHEQQRKPDEPAQSKKNTVCTLRTMSNNNNLKVSIPSFQFDDIMLETFRKGIAVEPYFKRFSKPYNGMLMLEKNDFAQAISSLNVKWSEQYKLSEMFDAIDIACHGSYMRRLRVEDIGESVLINSLHNVEEYQAQTIEALFQGLKSKNMLGKLRDLFNFFNTRRDSTCTIQEIKSILLEKLDLGNKLVNESQFELILPRYKSSYDPQRIDFSIFIRDMEYCNQGIKASLIWALELAEDIIKGIVLKGLQSPEQLFSKFTKVNGVILFEEFRRAMDDIQISYYHDDQEFRDFFNHIELQENKGTIQGTQHNDYSRIGLAQLCNTIKRLSQKTLGQIYSEILEKIYAETKKSNLSVTVYTMFSQIDFQKTGIVHFSDFKFALEDKLNCRSLKLLDLQILAKRYKPTRGGGDDMIEYNKFFADFEKIEKLGLKAGFDPLKNKGDQSQMAQTNKPVELPQEVKKIYQDMSNYCKKTQIIDSLCEELARRDISKIGMLSDQNILEVFRQFKMTLNKKQLNHIIYPLPFDQKGNYNYLVMIDMLFGKMQAQKVQQQYQLQGISSQGPLNTGNLVKEQERINLQNLVMSIRFKDSFELKYQTILNVAHQISKGSYLLREPELAQVFKRSGVVLLSSDLDFLQKCFQQLRNPNNNSIDFRMLTAHFGVTDASSMLLMELQKEIQSKNVNIEEALINYKEFMTFDDMMNMIQVQKLVTKQFTQQEHKTLFDQLSERKVEMEKSAFIRAIKNETDQISQDYMPYIVNELVYYICNSNIDIFKTVNPQAKKLSLQQFQTLLQQIKFIPTNPKELPSLSLYFAVDGDNKYVSIEKLLNQIRKIIPSYGQVHFNNQNRQGVGKHPENINAIPISKQLSLFNQRIKAILYRVNEHLRKNNIASSELMQQMDMNKNGQIEKSEFITYFTKDQPIKQVSISELELLYDALDMNKDGILSINEICLCIEGIQQTREQRMRGFDLDLEKEMIKEIDELFNFFDKNNDNSITLEELVVAFRSVNQNIGLKEAEAMMRIADKDKSNSIDRQEFRNLMLPKFKEEILNYEQNMDDLRRLFKECDTDNSNYLNKNEMKTALLKLNIDLTDVQLNDLMKEMDLDDNQNIDIDEFMAFLSIADQIKFKNPQAKSNIIKIRHARKLHAIDFYNCFKNLPQCFLPSFTTERYEKRNQNTPSYGIYPEFDSKTMVYKDLQKLDHISQVNSIKQYISLYQPHIGCEIQIEEFSGVPLPKREEFDWNKITHREVRAVLYDFRSSEFLSNSFIIQAQWKPEYEGKWLFNTNDNLNQGKNFIMRTDIMRQESNPRDVHLLIELVYYTLNQGQLQQVTCAWGSVPLLQLDKSAKMKIQLKGGSPIQEIKIEQSELHQEKKGFTFLKKLAANVDESHIIVNVKPFSKFQENTQYYISMLPSSCIVSKRLLSFAASFRLYCLKKLMKYQQQMTAPQGNFVIAQFRKIFDNPDVNFILGDCWEQEVNLKLNNSIDLQLSMRKMEEFMIKLYSIIYSSEFAFEHVFPTRSTPIESDLFRNREQLIKNALIPGRYKPTIDNQQQAKKKKDKENIQQENIQQALNEIYQEEYKPFNISEMEINISGIDPVESKQDELLKMYQQMGLIY